MGTKKELIAAIDAGTTGVRCCIFDIYGQEISSGYYRTPTFYPKPGIVEQDAETIINLTYKAVADAVSHNSINPRDITALCITAQRNGFVPIDRNDKFLSKMFIWQDQRGAAVHPYMREMLAVNGISLEDFYQVNGQPIGTFQAGNKVIWLKQFEKELYSQTVKFVTPHAFLIKAFGADECVEEGNDISCWLVADADTQKINTNLCKIFGIDANKFLNAVSPGTKVGNVSSFAASQTGILVGTPIYIASGDQQCGALGAGNYGTSDIVTVCMGTAGLCIAYSPKTVRHLECKCNIQGYPVGGYTMEAHSSSCMSSFAWARDMLLSERNLENLDINILATEMASKSLVGSNGVIFLPWLQGAECPHYNDTARGAFIGMSLATRKSDLIRATMEGICFENRLMLETLLQNHDCSKKILRVLGGASNNELWNQMQADIYGLPVETVTAAECTALGAAIICSVALNIYSDYKEAVGNMVHLKERYLPDRENKISYDKTYSFWGACYKGLEKATG